MFLDTAAYKSLSWKPLERVAFGLIYGAIIVLGLLMPAGEDTQARFQTAMILFGARVGWVISRSQWHSIAGALFAGSIGTALAGKKYVLH